MKNDGKTAADILALLDLSHDELKRLVHEIIAAEDLTVADCFPDYVERKNLIEASENCLKIVQELYQRLKPEGAAFSPPVVSDPAPPVKEKGRRGRRPKMRAEGGELSASMAEEPKKRGRKPKKKDVPGDLAEENNSASPQDAETLSAGEISAAADEDTEQDIPENLADPEEIKGFQMGKRLRFHLLYRMGKRYVRSSRVMTDAEVIGVYVPYVIRTRYKNFILYIVDDVAGIPADSAASWAKSNIKPYQGERWSLLSEIQVRSCKAVKGELNLLLRKVNGDLFIGNYITRGAGNVYIPGKAPEKIRFAVEGDPIDSQ